MKVWPRKMPKLPSAVIGFGSAMNTIGDEVDAVGVDRSGLHAFLAEEFSGRPDGLHRSAGPDLGRHVPERRQRYLVPEPPDHIGRGPEAHGRANLRRVAAIAGRDFHVD